MRMDVEVETRRPHDDSLTRSMVADMQQHSVAPAGLSSLPRNPPVAQLPKAAAVATTESGSSSVPSSSHQSQQQKEVSGDKPRGRERDREGIASNMEISTVSNGSAQLSSSTETPSRKRRRSRKGLDKKFECPHPGCGRTYSRAEHLYRHQLNHQPKTIYFCDYPDCKRSFVRQDLCARHRERHINRGPLQRKDPFASKIAGRDKRDPFKDVLKGSSSPESALAPPLKEEEELQGNSSSMVNTLRRMTVSSDASNSGMSVSSNESTPNHVKTENRSKMRRTVGDSTIPKVVTVSVDAAGRRYSMDQVMRAKTDPTVDELAAINRPQSNKASFSRPTIQTPLQTPSMHGLSIHPPFSPTTAASASLYSTHQISSGASTPSTIAPHVSRQQFIPQASFASFSLPPPEYPNLTQTTSANSGIANSTPTSSSPLDTLAGVNAIASATRDIDIEPLAPNYAVPVFGGDGFNRSPMTVTDDWANWLFSEGGGEALSRAIPQSAFIDPGPETQGYYVNDGSTGNFYNVGAVNHPMAVTSIIAPPSPPQESLLSEHKRQALVDLMEGPGFNMRQLNSYLPNATDEDNLFNLTNMHTYIANYWSHFHPQLPILHKPTFSADKAPEFLLLTIIAIGAACMDHRQNPELAVAAAEMSKDLIWSLRWCIFADREFSPPAKLWVFQALILVEIYEKLFATRQLHERAHIHHATTITLMRRGSSLTGRPADSPASCRDGTSQSGTSSQDEWWSKWIQSEATKRAAFAAFIIDAVHATMFGHSATMVAHEIQLLLPCDDMLWSAPSAGEVIRAEHMLSNQGIRPITFLEGLKRTLNGQKIQTNAFARTVLMAGLLSVSYHMNQRDLQVTAVGNVAQFGGKTSWRRLLTRAFDYWKKDYDDTLSVLKSTSTSTGTGPFDGVDYYLPATDDTEHESTFESRIVLHHLAHMAMHADIIDLQIYAGASRLLGKSIVASDYATAQRRMKEWAPTAKARDATFYALRFLSQVLLPEERANSSLAEDESAAMGPTRRVSNASVLVNAPMYSARDDHLLNRPWALYFAALIVWSYGYALEGPLVDPVIPQTPEESYIDMRSFLRKVAGVRDPSDLVSIRGRNSCLGLLATLRDMFLLTRWELLGEAAKLLNIGYNMLIRRH